MAVVATIAARRRRPTAPPIRFLDRVRHQNLVFTVLLAPGAGVLAIVGTVFLVPALFAFSQATRDAAVFDSAQLCPAEGGTDCRTDTQAVVNAYEPTDGTSPTRVSLQIGSGSPQTLVASFQKGQPAFTRVGEYVRVEVWRSHVMWMTNPAGETALTFDNPDFNKRQLLAGSVISAALVLLAGSNAVVWLVLGLRLRRARDASGLLLAKEGPSNRNSDPKNQSHDGDPAS